MNVYLKKNIKNIIINSENILDNRKKTLLNISNYIKEKVLKKNVVNLVFICTHNSRRSQLAQVWSYVAINYYKLENIKVFSGGTEVDVFNFNVINSLKKSGLIIETIKKNKFLIKISEQNKGLKYYSKKYDSKDNPKSDFLAIMTCSNADEKCSIIRGSEKKTFLPYKDPKTSDGSGNEKKIYDQTCFYIAQEMFLIMKNVKKSFKTCS